MADLYGWKIDHQESIPVTIAVDVTEGLVGKLTAADTAALCGAGETPAGFFQRTIDVSEGVTRTELVKGPQCIGRVAAAVAINEYVMTAASGTVTPVTANNDIIVGRALAAQSTVGGFVPLDTSMFGSFYGA